MDFILLQSYNNNDTDGCIGGLIGIGIVMAFVIWGLISSKKTEGKERDRRASLSVEQRMEEDAVREYGEKNTAMICPHCQSKGSIRIKAIAKKAGISGGKATAAVLTGGVSVLATGLSRKEDLTQAHCEECKSTWTF